MDKTSAGNSFISFNHAMSRVCNFCLLGVKSDFSEINRELLDRQLHAVSLINFFV